MVKGISRQVIVVNSPDPKLFEQAIFILKDEAIGADGITDEMLMKEAKKIMKGGSFTKKPKLIYYGPLWAMFGSAITAGIWLLATLI